MPEEMLLEPETAPVVRSLDHIEDLVRVVAREVGVAVAGMQGTALAFETTWRRMVMNVARGQTAEMQTARPRWLGEFEKQLGLLKRTHALATWLHGSGKADVPSPDVLVADLRSMERLKANVFDLWQTADDLEELAARDYPLTTADLDRIGPHRRPPAVYYAAESKPF